MNSTIDLASAIWIRSSYSEGNSQCVEVAHLDEFAVALRDSKRGDAGPVMLVSGPQWRAFLGAAGELSDRRL